MTKTESGSSTSGASAKMASAEATKRSAKRQKDNKKSSASTKKAHAKSKSAGAHKAASDDMEPIVVKHQAVIPDGLPKKYFSKSTFNTHDIMHAPVEKTLQMLDKILSGERLFTM